MVNKIWNSILAIIALGLIVGMIYNEISYHRISRFDYDLTLSQDDNIIIAKLENRLYTKDDYISISDSEKYRSVKKEVVPEKLYLLWFNYVDNKFYEFSGSLPYEAILRNMSSDPNIEIKLKRNNIFQLIVNEKLIQNFKAKEVSRPWFNNYYSREKMVFFARDKRKIKPYLNLESNSKFSEILIYPVTFSNYSLHSRDYANSLLNGRLLFKYKPLETRLMEQIDLSLIKKNTAKKGSEEYFQTKTLQIVIHLDPDQLYEILKSNPQDKFDLKIDIDKNDSLKSIYLIDDKEKFRLNVETNYRLDSEINPDEI